MEKFWKLLYYYCLGAFILSVIYLTVMLFISPRQDALKRGFIPCTEQLVINISECERGKMSCPMKHLWQDMKCNINVVLSGFGAWVKGEQKTPWANYLFEPKTYAEIDEELPYNGSVIRDMDNMEKQRLFIEEKQAELEAAKNRRLELNENVVMANPEEEIPAGDMKAADKKTDITEEKSGDIADEAFTDENWAESVSEDSKQPKKEEKQNEK